MPHATSRYRFADFTLSPRRRVLEREGRELALIPRYFDLLVFLVEHRHEAVHRRDIFDHVWNDVVVSDSALSQAVRTLRRTLGDDSREPRFIATVSRHGYRFVCLDVVEEPDVHEGARAAGAADAQATEPPADPQNADAHDADPRGASLDGAGPAGADTSSPAAGDNHTDVESLLQVAARWPDSAIDEDRQREAAELLHLLGTREALERLGERPGHALARAALRDTRWETPGAGEVPILGAPSPLATARALLRLRLRRAARVAATRWAGAATGAGLAGAIGGAAGGLLLTVAPASAAPLAVVPVLAALGAVCGAVGGAGVGAGLAMGEAVARSRRALLLALSGAAGGSIVGLAVQWLGRWGLTALVGLHVEVGGGLDGLTLGAAAGLGYAIGTTPVLGGLPTPRGRARWRTAGVVGIACGTAALALTVTGRPLVGGTLHAIATASQGAQMLLTPLGRLIGEPDFGPLSAALIGTGEGVLFGAGLALGLTRRPRG